MGRNGGEEQRGANERADTSEDDSGLLKFETELRQSREDQSPERSRRSQNPFANVKYESVTRRDVEGVSKCNVSVIDGESSPQCRDGYGGRAYYDDSEYIFYNRPAHPSILTAFEGGLIDGLLPRIATER